MLISKIFVFKKAVCYVQSLASFHARISMRDCCWKKQAEPGERKSLGEDTHEIAWKHIKRNHYSTAGCCDSVFTETLAQERGFIGTAL